MFDNILNFIKETLVKYITAASVIYKVMEIKSTIVKEELYQLIIDMIDNIKNEVRENSDRYAKLSKIPIQVNY